MSSWMFAMPVHATTYDDVVSVAEGALLTRGVPERRPDESTLPSVAVVLQALRAAGTYGSAWFTVDGVRPELAPAGVPDRALDVGEVTVHPAGGHGPEEEFTADTPVRMVGFRKPSPHAVLLSLLELVAVAGPVAAFDEGLDTVFVVSPDEPAPEVTAGWPWS